MGTNMLRIISHMVLTILADKPVLPPEGAAGRLVPPPRALSDHAHAVPE